MITDDSNDKTYAQALKAVFDNIEGLSPEEIEDKFYEVGSTYFPNNTQPKNIMLQEIHSGVIFDELDPYFPDSNQKETLVRFKKITNDYLSGNFYPSYFVLSGNYTDNNQGYTWNAQVKDGNFVVVCGNENIAKFLNRITETDSAISEKEKDLVSFQKALPEQIDNFTLISSEIQEYLA